MKWTRPLPQGKLEEAEPLYQDLLQAHQRVYGERHPSTLKAMDNVLFVLNHQGRTGEARPLLAVVSHASTSATGCGHTTSCPSSSCFSSCLSPAAAKAGLLAASVSSLPAIISTKCRFLSAHARTR